MKNAATRKYLTRDGLWYWPPGEMTERLAAYANAHGLPAGWPYYSLDGQRPVTAAEWDALRYRWRHAHGLTNVWSRRPLHDEERLKGTMRRAAPRVHNPTAASSAHLNQKPLEFMQRLITAVTEPGDVVWEPFGGLCSASVAAVTLGRRAFAAETDPAFAGLAAERRRHTGARGGRRPRAISRGSAVTAGHPPRGSRVRLSEVIGCACLLSCLLTCLPSPPSGTVAGWTGSNGMSGTPVPSSSGRCTRISSWRNNWPGCRPAGRSTWRPGRAATRCGWPNGAGR